MFKDLCDYYTDKLLLLYRYKKNLLSPDALEDEVFRLYCLFEIGDWVKEKHWLLWEKRVEEAIGVCCSERTVIRPVVSPEQRLELEWCDEDGIVIPDIPEITTTIEVTTTQIQTTIPSTSTTQNITTTVARQIIVRNTFGNIVLIATDVELVGIKNSFGENLGLYLLNDVNNGES